MIVDGEGRVKVMDFGIARAGAASQMTEAGSIIGTAQYLSPEQARGAPVDQTSDLYSTGIVLYELLTGGVPFNGPTGSTPLRMRSARAMASDRAPLRAVPHTRQRCRLRPGVQRAGGPGRRARSPTLADPVGGRGREPGDVHVFPDVADAIVVFGGGYAVTVLEGIGWLADRDVWYWGDIDTHGFRILDRLRQRFGHVRSMLMDEATLVANLDRIVAEATPLSEPLPHLTGPEQRLYRDLVEDRFGLGVRLEQERIALPMVPHTCWKPSGRRRHTAG